MYIYDEAISILKSGLGIIFRENIYKTEMLTQSATTSHHNLWTRTIKLLVMRDLVLENEVSVTVTWNAHGWKPDTTMK